MLRVVVYNCMLLSMYTPMYAPLSSAEIQKLDIIQTLIMEELYTHKVPKTQRMRFAKGVKQYKDLLEQSSRSIISIGIASAQTQSTLIESRKILSATEYENMLYQAGAEYLKSTPDKLKEELQDAINLIIAYESITDAERAKRRAQIIDEMTRSSNQS